MADEGAALTVRKMEAIAVVPIDDDGTPLDHGERMIEIEPGRWVSPVIAGALAFLADAIDQ